MLMQSDLQIQCTNAMYTGHNCRNITAITEAKTGKVCSNKHKLPEEVIPIHVDQQQHN